MGECQATSDGGQGVWTGERSQADRLTLDTPGPQEKHHCTPQLPGEKFAM